MSIRRSILGLTGAAVLAVAACSGTSSSGSPRVTLPSIVIPSSLPSSLPSVALDGFCADFKSKVDAAWPNVDASTAAAIAPLIRTWADKPETAAVKADVTTMVTWITQAATGSSVTSPPPDVMTAFDHIKAFAASNC